MKPTIRVPYFEVGTKNYIYDNQLLEYTVTADPVAMICQMVSAIRRTADNLHKQQV